MPVCHLKMPMPVLDFALMPFLALASRIEMRKPQTGFAHARHVSINVHGFIFTILIAHCHYFCDSWFNLVHVLYGRPGASEDGLLIQSVGRVRALPCGFQKSR